MQVKQMKYRLPQIEDRDILRAYVQEHYDIVTPFSVMQDNIIHVSEVMTL